MSTQSIYRYEVRVQKRGGREHAREYASEEPLAPGDVIRLQGRYWFVHEVEPGGEGVPARALAKPARYRLRLRHPDGREELGGFRRFRPDAPKLGHAFTTAEDGQQVSWEVKDERLALDPDGEPYLELVAERDFSEVEEPPDHELEHTLIRRDAESLPAGAEAAIAGAAEAGLSIELVALEPGELPDWEGAVRFIDALVLEELEDDLIEMCEVDTDNDPRDTWLAKVKERLLDDLGRFRDDVEGPHDQIEEWSFRNGRIFASVGNEDDESDPDRGHGWMCRLLDSEALGAAGFERVRKAEIAPE
jgi:hypothetical protein